MSLNKLLAKAVLNGNVEKVKELLERGADVNYRCFGNRSTPLLIAVTKQNYELVKVLIEANARVDISDAYGYTPFVNAVRSENMEIVKKLCEAYDFNTYLLGYNGNADHTCCMPLHVAVENRNLEMVRFLMSKGALLTDEDDKWKTPLHIAVERPHLDILKEMVKHKRTVDDVNVLDGKDETALQLAVALRLKYKVCPKKRRDRTFYPLDVLRILVLQGAKVTGVNCEENISPLSAAMEFYEEDPECTQSLIKYGMFVYATKSSWQSICNFNDYPFDDEVCQKTLIKYCTLKYADELILKTIETFHERSFYGDVVVFVFKCEAEIEKMKNYHVNRQFSLYEVLLQCLINSIENFFSVVEDSQEMVHCVLNALCCSRFPIYRDVIASVFSEKTHLEMKLMNYYIFTWKRNLTKVILNRECLMAILKYLSVEDLLNFTLAYFEYHEHLSKTMINNISCITIGC